MKKKATDSYIFFDKADERKCDEKNCNEPGEFFAPKSPNSSEKYLFCSKHVKLYNKRWNFFAGKSQNEIYEYQKKLLRNKVETSRGSRGMEVMTRKSSRRWWRPARWTEKWIRFMWK